MLRKIVLALVASAALAIGAAGVASAATVPLIHVTQGTTPGGDVSASGVSGYYWADDGHTHPRYVQATVTAVPSLNNLNGFGTTAVGAAGATLGNENTGDAAQIGVFDVNGTYKVAWAEGSLPNWHVYDDAVIEAGLLAPISTTTPYLSLTPPLGVQDGLLLNNIVINAGDRLLLSISYSVGRHHTDTFSVTDLSRPNEHRSVTTAAPEQAYTEYGIGVLSNAGDLTSPASNFVASFANAATACYSCAKAAPITRGEIGYYGHEGLSQVDYVNSSTQTLISPDSSLGGGVNNAMFSVYEGSTTP